MKKKIFALSIAVMLAAADTYAYKSAVGDIDNNRMVDAKDGIPGDKILRWMEIFVVLETYGSVY